MQAGELCTRVRIERPSVTQDTIGQPLNAWTEVVTVWADVRYQSGVQAAAQNIDASIVRASIRIRYRAGIDTSMRAVQGATVFNIKAVLSDARRRYLDLVCEVVA